MYMCVIGEIRCISRERQTGEQTLYNNRNLDLQWRWRNYGLAFAVTIHEPLSLTCTARCRYATIKAMRRTCARLLSRYTPSAVL